MFPNAHDTVTELPELAVNSPITSFISSDLPFPELRAVLGHVASAMRTTVPEAPVNENYQPPFGKVKVGLAGNLGHVAPPTTDSTADQKCCHARLGRTVSVTSHKRHASGALFGR